MLDHPSISFSIGIEVVCCPTKTSDNGSKSSKQNDENISKTILNLLKYLPQPVDWCNDTFYINNQTQLQTEHYKKISELVERWEKAEKRFHDLDKKEPETAQAKMKSK